MRRAGECANYALAGGLAFWLPSIALHAIRGNEFSGGDVELLTFASLVTTTASLVILGSWQRSRAGLWLIALWQLLGLWVLGPLCMMISWSFSGGGFTRATTWQSVAESLLFFPVFTPMMATYDGSLAALGLITLALMSVVSLTGARQQAHWLPPSTARN